MLAATFAVGRELANGVVSGPTGRVARVKIDVISQSLPTRNVIAQTPGRDDNVIVVGAHLDSVEDGPGVNDDGSGSGTILEIAEAMAKTKPRNAVRFIWFSAEEAGLRGDARLRHARVAQLRALRVRRRSLELPRPGRGRCGGVGRDRGGLQRLTSAIRAGIPAGGIFAGAEVVKTAAQAAVFGGAAGEQFDPCYHAFCDSIATIDGAPPAIALNNPASAAARQGNALVALDQFSDAAAHSVITLAQSTEMLNGERGKGNFNSDAKIEDQAGR